MSALDPATAVRSAPAGTTPTSAPGSLSAATDRGAGVPPLPAQVDIVEVGLRDGLQSAVKVLPTAAKLDLLAGLLDAGVKRLQVASFVHPERVPQMADADELVSRLPSRDGVVYSGLVLNRRGVERAAAAGLKHVDVSMSVSDAHSRRNAGMGVVEAEERLLENVAAAHAAGLSVRGGLQCVFGSVSGEVISVELVARLAGRLAAAGVAEVALADSAGLADPLSLARTVLAVREAAADVPLVLHLHDTRGLGIANLMAAMQLGVARFDTAFGGLGGCPFIQGAAGNVATEDAVSLLDALGIGTGVDVAGVCRVSARAKALLGESLPSRVFGLWERSSSRQDSSEERPRTVVR